MLFRGISLERIRLKSPSFFQARVVVKPLVSIIGRLVPRISVDTHTRHTDAHLAAHARRGLIMDEVEPSFFFFVTS